jgi:hypothetical protein
VIEVLVDTSTLYFFDPDTGGSIWEEVVEREVAATTAAS